MHRHASGDKKITRDTQWEPLGRAKGKALQPELWDLVQSRLLSMNQHACLLYGMLDELSSGLILLGAEGDVRHLSPRAKQVLKQHGGLTLHSHRGLQAVMPDQDIQLQEILLKTASGINIGRCNSHLVGLQREHGGVPLVLKFMSMREVNGNQEFIRNGVVAAIFLNTPAARHMLSRELLQQMYGLSDREFELCQAFLSHASLDEMANTCGLTLGTVRVYMKGIFAKTGQHSQAALMRLLLGLTLLA